LSPLAGEAHEPLAAAAVVDHDAEPVLAGELGDELLPADLGGGRRGGR
jgi:hypothetical protein